MWGCDYGHMSGGWWGGFFPGSLFSLLLWGLVLFLIVFLAIRIFKSQTHGLQGPSQDHLDSEAILKARFARGEISLEEFIKMRQTLTKP
ncbi:MAG: SHOCT domain-containing protein [Deltaproteobacteria bacterium]|nr:SHOCT domain-containing protein [Deltaproteobacteria bacterium]